MSASACLVEMGPIQCEALGQDPIGAVNQWLRTPEAPAFAFLLAWSTDGVTWGRVDRSGTTPVIVKSERMITDLSPGGKETRLEVRLFNNDRGDDW